ncbi:RNA polymerase sigma factor [Methylococcus sp. EFPC2]|uniref:RNA polymerase sigma factor n=1 Tax=Methylococcus sp. EFPC2 TaxID=2812648 RepID=UPI00196773DE|nr:sigma-70 family RNA polymerase sigma factor [Methylococcus sp. EFPC2]QSA98640.1 sigma-70 family RNA polymerase sigma factor [Methylococcus sp. EFPC2]
MYAITHEQICDLFRDHREAVVAFLLKRVQCKEMASDLSQEAYLRLLRKDAIPYKDNLTAYLYRTAERLAIDFLRQNKRWAEGSVVLDEELPCPNLQPEELAAVREQCELLLDAIASLPPVCRHVLLLRRVDELSYGEIAGRLGISEKTVQRHLVKAMMSCHARLENPLRGRAIGS